MPLLPCLRARIPMSTVVLLMLQLEAEAWIGSWSGEQSNLKTEGAEPGRDPRKACNFCSLLTPNFSNLYYNHHSP